MKLPPHRALRFLRWFCREDYIDEIEGDLLELYEWRQETSIKKANRLFIWDVIRSFRPRNIKFNIFQIMRVGMYKNYIKIALRVFQREKSFTLINVFGLAVGLAVALLIMQYVKFELSYENTHQNADQIVRLTMDYLDGGTVNVQDCETYPPIGPRVLTELPEVTNFTRVYSLGEPELNVQIGETPFLIDKVFAVDASFFSIFTSSLIYGTTQNLFKEPFQVVLTEKTALKFFNRRDVVGETLIFPDSRDLLFKIVGVVADSPLNTHLKYNVLISYPTMTAALGEKDDNWQGNNTYTYVQLATNTDYDRFSTALAAFSQRLNEEEKIKNEAVIGQKIKDIHLYSKKTFEPEINGDAKAVYFLLGVALLVIISAFVNYINLATSKALDRAREVGIRKVVGSTEGQLRMQFLFEAALINLFAGIFAILLIGAVKPTFFELAGLPASFPIFADPTFWIVFAAFIVFGILFSGAYPAMVLASFKPSAVLKGSFSHSSRGVLLRKSLVVFQFAITIILLIQTFTVYKQLNYMRDLDLGLEVDQTIVISAPVKHGENTNYATFKQALLKEANIKAVSLSEIVPGQPLSQFSTTTGINLPDAVVEHNYNFYISWIDHDFIPLMGLDLVSGKNFDENTNPDNNYLIVNEKAIELWGIQNVEQAIGQKLDFNGRSWTIRGVLKNYHQGSPKAPHIPIIFRYYPDFSTLTSIKFTGGNPRAQIAQIEKLYKTNFPYSPFSYFFLDSEYDKQFKADERFRDVFGVLTLIAILIACLGLFGLASFTVAKRTKEIGIRKVIGASTMNIMFLLSSDFIKTVAVSILIGIPITYFLVQNWLANFALSIQLNAWLFIIPVILVFVLVMLSLSVKTISTALANPIECLKEE